MNKIAVCTAVFALAWATSAHAQVMQPWQIPQPQPPYGQPAPPAVQPPAPPEYGQPPSAPYGYPPPAAQTYPNAPAQAPAYPYAAPSSEAPAPSGPDRSSPGFHIAFGLGFAGGGIGRPGLATQFKIGARLSPSFTLYYYALDNWYETLPGPNQHWRISAVNGIGVDYFFVPKMGVRAGLGVAANTPSDWSDSTSNPRHFGYSYFMGLTWEILDSRHHLSIDPVINVLQLSESSRWYSYTDFLLTLNWVYN